MFGTVDPQTWQKCDLNPCGPLPLADPAFATDPLELAGRDDESRVRDRAALLAAQRAMALVELRKTPSYLEADFAAEATTCQDVQ